MPSEADEQFARHLADELGRRLGPEVSVLGLGIESRDTDVRLVASCATGGEPFDVEASGETALVAYNALLRMVAEERLRRAFTRVVEQK